MGSRRLNYDKLIFLDGAMGTMLHRAGLKAGEVPEAFNLLHPEIIADIHRQYIEAGADIITTNTFGASEYKLNHTKYSVEEVISSAVKIARTAALDRTLVALDIGPTGLLMEPMGDLSFDEAYNSFARQVKAGAEAGADVILIETMSDIYEAKAAILAAKENCELPVFCTMTFQENERTLTGTDPATMVNIIQSLGVDALGVNCSVGPAEIVNIVGQIISCSKIPVIVQPNAGMPKLVDGKTSFDVKPGDFASFMEKIAALGASIFGGCCGTSPEYLRLTKELLADFTRVKPSIKPVTAVSSSRRTVILGDGVKIIGERINPTGKKKFKEALREKDMDYILDEAISQKEAGAHILDVNVGLPDIDEKTVMLEAIDMLQASVDLPLQIDSSSPEVIEAAVRRYSGRPIINSVNGEEKSMKTIFPIVKKYGACVVGLTLDENGIPMTAEERVDIAEKIISTAAQYGIPKEDIVIDCLVLTASAQQKEVMETIKAVRLVKERLGVATCLGVSNVSFGLPNRALLNKYFLTMAMAAGLDAPIINPLEKEMIGAIDAFKVLANLDSESRGFINKYAEAKNTGNQESVSNKTFGTAENIRNYKPEDSPNSGNEGLKEIVLKGLKEKAASKTLEMLEEMEPIKIVDDYLIPTLDVIGVKYEKGDIFLTQMIQAAETVKMSFEVIKKHLTEVEGEQISKGRILLATVKGDVHDIGKNIVKILLENYGFEIVDMGKDVPVEDIVAKVKEEDIKLVGLSALMTTTVRSMEETIKALRKSSKECRIMVGGAVMNEDYAKMIDADYYACDAREGVKIARSFFGV